MVNGHIPHSLEYMPIHVPCKGVLHYTCNAPPSEVLKKNNIEELGVKFGCLNNKEVLLLPESFYLGERPSLINKDQLKLDTEILLKNLK